MGVAPEELPHPPFGSDYRIKIKLQSLFLYCYTKEVVSIPGDYHTLLSISPMLMIAYRAYNLYCMGGNLFHKIFLQHKGSWVSYVGENFIQKIFSVVQKY